MKKYLIVLMLLCLSVNAEMVWVGINPTIQSSTKSAQAVIDAGAVTLERADLLAGSIVSIVVNDSSANVDTIQVTWYSHPINTEDVISATGLVEITVVTDTSGLFSAIGDSVMAYYTIKTGHIPYDATTDFTLVSLAKITVTSETATQIPIALNAATVGQDTLFKAWTWFEITLMDTTRWIEGEYTQDWIISGAGLDDATVAGTYNLTTDDAYKYWFPKVGGTPDSIAWCHFDLATGANTGTIDTTAVTGSAQNLDSGMTLNFNATTGHTQNDTFMFIYDDSLHYGKQTDFTVRMGLNLLRK